jgi:hypothetical protein
MSTEPPSQLQRDLPPVKVRYVPLSSPMAGGDEMGIRRVASETMRPPCRRCLQDANSGEELKLLSYDPFPPNSETPYRGLGPIFVHADECKEFQHGDEMPVRQLQRTMALRAYDNKHMMVASEIVPGKALERVSGEMLADETASYIQVYNASPGCFAFRIERA